MIDRQSRLASAATALGLVICCPAPSGAQVVNAPNLSAPPGSADQSAPAPAPSTSRPSTGVVNSSAAQVSEVIVTANERSESINKVSMSIAAVSGDTLKQQTSRTQKDFPVSFPASMSRRHTSVPRSTRSVGSASMTPRLPRFQPCRCMSTRCLSPSLLWRPRPRWTPNASRCCSALKAPLFGQNSTGGAINWIAAKPTNTLQGVLTETFGNYLTFDTDAFISGPLTDTVKALLRMVGGSCWTD